ncbi:BTAD domain-containing putative transcriptional regulator, partial [Pseudonocardia lacus]|uniref:BTAD domain-containing putative transcriptional regulator n=1 Tax=Pseudonocardia lacus TaxID=2835865 RepID=UPI001BDCBC53
MRTLLRVLAVRQPDLVPHDVLAEALWPDRMPVDLATNLSVLVNRARRAAGSPDVIVTGSRGYALGACSTDIADLLAAVADARAAGEEHAAVARACASGLALWAEPLPEDTYAEWAHGPRERLRRAHIELCVRAARAALGLGDPRAAVACAGDAVEAEPLDESAALVLAEALAAAGDPAGALARLHELRGRLNDELGIDPSPQVQRLQMALLRGGAEPRPAAAHAGPLAFVGRDDELAALRETTGAGGVAVVVGPAGCGKSRLLAELAGTWPRVVITARAFLPERAEAWSLARSLLREALAVDAAVVDLLPARSRDALAVLLPELGGDPAPGGESLRALLLAGGVRLLEAAARDGALLVVDDLQWADPSSVTLIGSALARVPALTAVLAHRPELPPTVRASLVADRQITLGPLPAAAVTALVGDPALAGEILEATDGTPFAVAEVLHGLAGRPAPDPGAATAALVAELGRAGQR